MVTHHPSLVSHHFLYTAAMSALYLALTLFTLLCLLLLLLRPGRGRAMTVWMMAALLPLLTAVTVALSGGPR
ncbi:hypothetical protein GCM10008957_08010 [Deinococcus ruber]|uniref:Uncharacterized protein n=2 Tax=Deinococcus ruber TaxID=1848197 RepID=A0A918BY77_9DEIO|nr:hypothetical protein GCM10008957_08010 [Deinococcus ruber]